MFENLEVFEKRYEELSQKLYDPSVLADQAMYTDLMKEFKNITPIVEKYREYLKAVQTVEDSRELLNEGGLDRELKDMAEEDLQTAKADIERFSEELKILLLPRDPNDE